MRAQIPIDARARTYIYPGILRDAFFPTLSAWEFFFLLSRDGGLLLICFDGALSAGTVFKQ